MRSTVESQVQASPSRAEDSEVQPESPSRKEKIQVEVHEAKSRLKSKMR